MKNKLSIILILSAGLMMGWFLSNLIKSPNKVDRSSLSSQSEAKEKKIWTCSMHPQIQLPKPGKCPLCGMNLIPLANETSEGMPSERRMVMSPSAMKIAEIQTGPVKREFVTTEIRMVGKVGYDETRIAYITAWTDGRIDRLYIDQTGIPVKKGDHMAYLYSPELLSAQEEYLQALESVESVKESRLDIIKSTSADTVINSREKLKLLGITDQQIKELEVRKEPNDHMTIYATASGIVIQREVEEGDYVKTGSRIYSIVDLNNVWVKLDAYEADLQWLRYGQKVKFEAEAYPGDFFKGRISFIDPVLDEVTRTVKIRVDVDNSNGKLKPGMFIRAIVHADIAEGGRVMDTYLAGKWIAPMHPEIVRDEPGLCPICKMPLVPIETMGYTVSDRLEKPLVVPASAVLKTGKRAIVYVKTPNVQKPTFEGREIILGARAGDYYIVKAGLSEGELVVTQGNFKIDSALQIQAKPSMMNPEGGVSSGGHDMSKMGGNKKKKDSMSAMADMSGSMAPQEFLEQLRPVYGAYFDLQTSLVRDDFNGAKTVLEILQRELENVDMNLLKDKLHAQWMSTKQQIQNSIILGFEAKTLEDLRKDSFSPLAAEFLSLEKKFSHSGPSTYFKTFCPMALNGKGAFWLQSQKEIANPFLGKNMPTCGDVKAELKPMMMESQASKSNGGKGRQGSRNHGGGHE